MGLRLVCPRRSAAAEHAAADAAAEVTEPLVREQVPLDDESRKVLESACEGLPGHFQEGGFVVQGAQSVAKEATGEVILFNAEKGYGLIRADTVEGEGVEVFFASSGLNMAVKVGDKVRFMEDHTMIEGQICAYNIKKLL
eukprot:s440_g14.t1